MTAGMSARRDIHLRIYQHLKDELRQASKGAHFLREKRNNPLFGTCKERYAIGHQYHSRVRYEAVTNFQERMQMHWLIKPGDHIEVTYLVSEDTVHKFRCVYDGWEVPRGWGFEGKDEDGPYLKYHFAANPLLEQQYKPRAASIIQITNRNKLLRQL